MLDVNHAPHYYANILIKSFRDRESSAFWETGKGRRVPPAELRQATQRKLLMLDAAMTLDDLKSPPGNRLHPLQGDRAGQWAIRINDQFRICFRWDDGAHDVEITDYH